MYPKIGSLIQSVKSNVLFLPLVTEQENKVFMFLPVSVTIECFQLKCMLNRVFPAGQPIQIALTLVIW